MSALLTALMLVGSASAGPLPLDEAAAQARRDHPELVQRIETLKAVRTRSGHTILPTNADPRVAAVHLELAMRPDLPSDVRAAHARLGAEAGELDVVRDALEAGSPGVRASIYAGLQRSQVEGASRLLASGVEDADQGVRTVALSVLSRHADAASHVDVLVRAVADTEPEVRQMAVRGLGWHGSAANLATVEQALHDDDARVRELALGAVVTLDADRAVLVAPKLLDDTNPRVRASAERLLR